MELSFHTVELRNLCEDIDHAIKELGEGLTNKLINRLSDLLAARSIAEYPPLGNPQEVYVKDQWCYKIELDENSNIIMTSGHPQTPKLPDGKTDWSKVHRIKLIQINKNDC